MAAKAPPLPATIDLAKLAGGFNQDGAHRDGPGDTAGFVGPQSVACCPDGSVIVTDFEEYYSDNCDLHPSIRTISPAGVVGTLAGSPTEGSQDGQGTAAQFSKPGQIARGTDGSFYVADSGNNKIRKVTAGGLVSTVAGTGAKGDKDGHCSEATFNYPSGVAVSPMTGNIVVVDNGNHRIRVIVLPENIVYTLAGSTSGFADGVGPAAQFGDHMQHVACDDAGDVYAADFGNRLIRKVTVADRAVTTLVGAADCGRPTGIAVDGSGNVVFADADCEGRRVCLVTPAGVVRTLVDCSGKDGEQSLRGVAVDAAGEVLVADSKGCVHRTAGAGLTPPAALRAAAPTPPASVVADLATLLGEGAATYADVEFLVGGETIPAHKGILAARCEYFATMFGSGFAEGGGAAAPLPVADTTPAAFRALLRFLYTGAVDLEEASVLDVASLAQRYLVADLHERCVAYCAANVTPTNALPWLVAADAHAIAGLRATLLAYVAANLDEIKAAAPDTQATLEARPKLMFALFEAAASPPPAKRQKTGT